MDEPLGGVGTEFLFENESVKVWKLTLEPGEASPWHEHFLDYLFVVTESALVQTEYPDHKGEPTQSDAGSVVMLKRGSTHRLANVGKTRYSNVIVELKNGE